MTDQHGANPPEIPFPAPRLHHATLVAGVALLPLLFTTATVLSAHHLDEHRRSRFGDVLSNWYFLAVVGIVVTVPVLVVSLCGAATLPRRFRAGRILSTFGCGAALLGFSLITYAGVTEALTGGIQQQDFNSWAPALTAAETWVFTLPFAGIAAANIWVLFRLWAHRPPERMAEG